MRVAHVCTSALSYKILYDKLQLLTQQGAEVHLISSSEGAESSAMYLSSLQDAGIHLHVVEMSRSIRPLKDIASIYRMVRVMHRYSFDVVHTHTSKAGIIGRVAARAAGVPVVVHTAHGLPFFVGQKRTDYHLYRLIEWLGSMFCDMIACQNREDLLELAKFVPESKLTYEGNGVNLQGLRTIRNSIRQADIDAMKGKYGIQPERKLLLVAARLEPVKDHRLLLEALVGAKRRGHKDFICLLAGEGQLEEELKQAVEENGLREDVKFLGYQKDIYHWIQMVDIVVLTSQKEGLPRIVMESMVFSKPIVATCVKGTKELVVHGETGLLAQHGDAEALGRHIVKLLTNEPLARAYGEAGERRIVKEFDERDVVARMMKMYHTRMAASGKQQEVHDNEQVIRE